MSEAICRRAAPGIGGAGAALVATGLTGLAAAYEATGGEPAGQLGGTLELARGQIARLTFMHHVHDPGEITPCIVIARIRGLDGSVLGERRFEPPPPNQRAFIEFAYPLPGRGRLQLYGELEHTPGHRIGGIHKTYDARTGATIAAFLPSIVPSPELGSG